MSQYHPTTDRRALIRIALRVPILVGLLFAFASCGGDSRPEIDRLPAHPVRGKVLHKGKPAKGVMVILHPKDKAKADKYFKAGRPRGYPDAKGEFMVTTYDSGDGAPVGDYEVVAIWKITDQETGEEGPDLLKSRYNNPQESGLLATVKEGDN
ncbi:MAG: hypothetical protein N2C14_02590, partial [Planctomycetales bacterium]